MTKPLFNDALRPLNWTLQPNLPARFTGVTSRVFPLKAKMDVLRAFCDAYLNIAPEIVQFQPALPFVYLMILNYGRMTAAVENLGWVAQHEVAFAVPLEWYRMEDGKRVFVDVATVCPFIFVDNELSLSTGRQVYGWPKVKAWMSPETSPWLEDPRHVPRLMNLSMMLYPQLFAGKRQEARVFLEIKERRLPSLLQVPPDLSSPLSVLLQLPTALMSSMNLLSQLFEITTRLPILGYPSPAGGSLLMNLVRTTGWNPSAAPSALNLITLKQFRDAQIPARVCYQAIVNSLIRQTRFNGAGVLGEYNLLRGDLSGGFEVRLHRYTEQPIIESLGIEVARELGDEGGTVSVIDPVLPFWMDVDLEYGVGDALCWRTRRSGWQTKARPSSWRQEEEAAQKEAPIGDESIADEDPLRGNNFNTALGAAGQDMQGPFDFPNTTVRVLPLMADESKLKLLCDRYLNDTVKGVYRFEPWGTSVYLIVTNYEEMASPRDNMGWWADREAAFYVPVKLYAPGEHGRLLSVALVPVFGFANNSMAAITAREVDGEPTLTAALTSPVSSWLGESGPTGEGGELLTLETSVFPAINLGQRAEWRPLLSIHHKDALAYNDDIRWRIVAQKWGHDLLQDHARKVAIKAKHPTEFDNARALAIEILANQQSVNTITVKQFRDVTDPLRACYQALLCGDRVIDIAYDVREIEDLMHLSIIQYPNLPIVEMLGLVTKWTNMTGENVVHVLQPIRPFWMRLGVKQRLAQNLCWRVDETWVGGKLGPFYFERPDPTDVGGDLVHEINQSPRLKQRPVDALRDWLARNPVRLTRTDAAKAVETIEPQMVIESLLSQEWLNWGNPRWYQQVEEKPDFCVPLFSIGERTNCESLFGGSAGSQRCPGWYSQDTPPQNTAA
ncbi:MAG TPA: hypothetical protein VMW17_21690 [Candidatus Binatia bacterium]|nr:hypothetical protein [Candidatus Binatia bacterium]